MPVCAANALSVSVICFIAKMFGKASKIIFIIIHSLNRDFKGALFPLQSFTRNAIINILREVLNDVQMRLQSKQNLNKISFILHGVGLLMKAATL